MQKNITYLIGILIIFFAGIVPLLFFAYFAPIVYFVSYSLFLFFFIIQKRYNQAFLTSAILLLYTIIIYSFPTINDVYLSIPMTLGSVILFIWFITTSKSHHQTNEIFRKKELAKKFKDAVYFYIDTKENINNAPRTIKILNRMVVVYKGSPFIQAYSFDDNTKCYHDVIIDNGNVYVKYKI